MVFETGQKYRHKPTERDVIYIGPSSDKEYAVFEGPYGDYDSDVWENFEVIKEPRRFWLLVRKSSPTDIGYYGICDSSAEASARINKYSKYQSAHGCEVIPVIEVLPDENTSV